VAGFSSIEVSPRDSTSSMCEHLAAVYALYTTVLKLFRTAPKEKEKLTSKSYNTKNIDYFKI
jgi:hypothetical protein